MDDKTPRVSVLTVAGRDTAQFAATAASVLSQDMKDFEFVVVADAAGAASEEQIRTKDARVRVVTAPDMHGDKAWTTGFDLCRGTYVAMLAPGDVSRPPRLARQAACLDRDPGLLMVATSTAPLVPGSAIMAAPKQTEPGVLSWWVMSGGDIPWSSVMLRRDAVGARGPLLNERHGPAASFDLWHRLVRMGEIARIDEALTQCAAAPEHGDAWVDAARPVLAETYRPILGAGADRAADLLARHVGGGAKMPDRPTLDEIEAILQSMGHYLVEQGTLPVPARALVAAERGMLRERLAHQHGRPGTRGTAPAVSLLGRFGRAKPGPIPVGWSLRGA